MVWLSVRQRAGPGGKPRTLANDDIKTFSTDVLTLVIKTCTARVPHCRFFMYREIACNMQGALTMLLVIVDRAKISFNLLHAHTKMDQDWLAKPK